MMPTCPYCNSPFSTGTTLCPACGASIPESATTSTDLEREVGSLLAQGNKIEAVKVHRDNTGSSLKDAKDAVEALQLGVGLSRPPEADADLEAEVLRLMGQGEKIKAVKLYKDRTGSTLFDSKREVEAIAQRHGIAVPSTGCTSVLVVLFVALVAITVVVAMLMVLR